MHFEGKRKHDRLPHSYKGSRKVMLALYCRNLVPILSSEPRMEAFKSPTPGIVSVSKLSISKFVWCEPQLRLGNQIVEWTA